MDGKTVRLRAPAKINLYLRVLGRRPDGYHLLATLMQKLALYDQVELESVSDGITLECPGSDLPVTEENIALRAAHLFFKTLQGLLPERHGVEIILKKGIPIAVGLGGGSSDAAAVLVGLDKLFQTGCSKQELAAMGLQLGADVPLFIYDWPVAWATGIGERLTPAKGLENARVVLVNPGFFVSTKWVYENLPLTLDEKISNLYNSHSEHDDFVIDNPFAQHFFKSNDVYNDLEQVTQTSFKEIALIKEQLLAAGASSALMSGSGPTVFGIFPSSRQVQAEKCYQQMLDTYSQTFLVTPLPDGQSRFQL